MNWIRVKELKEIRGKALGELQKYLSPCGTETRVLDRGEAENAMRLEDRIKELDAQIRAEESKPRTFIGSPCGMSNLRQLDATEVRALRAKETCGDYLRARGADMSDQVSAGQLIRALVVGAKNEAEQRAINEGFRAGSFNLPPFAVAGLLDGLRAGSAVMKAGATVILIDSAKSGVMREDNAPTVTELAAGASASATTNNYSNQAFSFATLRGIVGINRETLADAVIADKSIEDSIAEAMAQKLDAYSLAEIAGTSGVGSVTGGALSDYSKLVAAMYLVLNSNSNPSAVVMHPREMTDLASLEDSTGQPLRKPDLLVPVPFYTSTSIAVDGGAGDNESTMYVGDWTRLIVGVRSSVEIRPLLEKYIDNGRIGFEYNMRIDAVVARPGAFAKIVEITS